MAKRLLLGVLFLLSLASTAPAADSLDLSDWGQIPVYHNGRPMPLDTLANLAKDIICHKEKARVTLDLVSYVENYNPKTTDLSKTEYADAVPLFPGNPSSEVPPGTSRKWSSREILLSWLAEPEKWEVAPFIYCPHENLRKVVGVPAMNGTIRLQYVSPLQIAESESLLAYMQEFQDRRMAGGEDFESNDLDKLVQELLERYNLYRSISFDPRMPLTFSMVTLPGSRGNLMRQLTNAIRMATEPNQKNGNFLDMLEAISQAPNSELKEKCANARRAILGTVAIHETLRKEYRQHLDGAVIGEAGGDLNLQTAVKVIQELQPAAAELEATMAREKNNFFKPGVTLSDDDLAKLRPIFRELHFKAAELSRLAFEMHVALYDDRDGIAVIPAMNASAISRNRPTEDSSQPWYSLPTVLYSNELMEPYPQRQVDAVRSSWSALTSAYTDRQASGRAKAVAKAQSDLAASLRTLGEGIQDERKELVEKELPSQERDDTLLAYTAYPSVDRIATEVHYNVLSPFFYSFLISLFGLTCYVLAFGKIHKAMFWAGTLLMAIAMIWTVYGFSLRITITQWAPVTNMYETVLFVPFIAATLGVWFLLLPLTWPGIRDSWRFCALPVGWEATPLTKSQLEKMPASGWMLGGAAVTVARILLMAGVLWILAFAPYADGGRSIVALTPREWTANGLMVWFASFLCLVAAVWWLPRVIPTLVLSLGFIPWDLFTSDRLDKQFKETYARHAFGIAAAGAASFLFCLAWFSPVLDENFSPLQPVLRSNFWLTIHVLTIVASYGAGFLAWGLGIVAMFFYLIGRYRDPVVHVKSLEKLTPDGAQNIETQYRRPPEECAALAGYSYRAIQVAVLLLAAGTILGGLWADVSWGRFWGWDPKEVWALISLLVYLAVLHGRFAGWFNNFGLIAGTVIGLSMIVMSWYGVNFALPKLANGNVGLHSYGTGAGGLGYVIGFVILNWVLLAGAMVRYAKEMKFKVQPKLVDGSATAERLLVDEPVDAALADGTVAHE